MGGLLGCFVTLRQLSFFSHAVGHSALVGIVLGVLMRVNPTWTLLPFTMAFGLLTLYLIEETNLWSDTIFSIAVSTALAIGVLLTSLVEGYRGNLMGVLFGDILAIDTIDIALIFGLVVVSAVFLTITLRQQILLTLNPAVAAVQGIPVRLYRYLFVVLLSLAVAVSIKAVGALLVNAFLVIPASAAKLISHRFLHFMLLSVVFGVCSSLGGMVASGLFNIASGPTIVLVQFLLFITLFGFSRIRTMAIFH